MTEEKYYNGLIQDGENITVTSEFDEYFHNLQQEKNQLKEEVKKYQDLRKTEYMDKVSLEIKIGMVIEYIKKIKEKYDINSAIIDDLDILLRIFKIGDE